MGYLTVERAVLRGFRGDLRCPQRTAIKGGQEAAF